MIGLKIGKNNVKTDSDPNIPFSSQFQTLPIALEGMNDTTGNAGNNPIITIKHGLGYIPAFMFYHTSTALPGKWFQDQSQGTFLPTIQTSFDYIRIDKENLIYKIFFNNGASETITIHYILFSFPIALSL